MFKYRPINTNPRSSQLNNWLRECLETHHSCPKAASGQMPTRVIEILDNGMLALRSGFKQGSYMALSYCWGGPQTFSTSNSNLRSMSTSFPVSSLPQTLQDAVELARTLDCEYIWIDSLCIIQDSPADKDEEIPKMLSYYKNAFITIAAGGNTCHRGFLQPHSQCSEHVENPLPKDLLDMPCVDRTGKTVRMFFRKGSPYRYSLEPITRRGWTFQERALSPRMVMFGARTIWQCNEKFVCDGGVEDWTVDPRTMKQRHLEQSLRKASLNTVAFQRPGLDVTASEINLPLSSIYKIWREAVEAYSWRDMSLPEDKLPAISALAIEFATVVSDDYLAGIWAKDLLRGLLWSTWPYLSIKKPSEWRAPSWSWAAVLKGG